MFKEKSLEQRKGEIKKVSPENTIESDGTFKGFSDWKEKNSYVAKELVAEKTDEVLAITNKLADEQGRFSNFLNIKNIEQLSDIFRRIAVDKKVMGGLYDPKYDSIMGKEAYADSDFGRVLIEALPSIFHNKIESGDHTNNLAILHAWAQVEEHLTYEEDRMSNEAHIKESFKDSLNSKNISVLEKLYVNYLGRQLNQSDAGDLKNFLPEIYEKFKNQHSDIERFRKKVPPEFNLVFSPSARRIFLLDKFELFNFSYPESSLIDDSYINTAFFRAINEKKLEGAQIDENSKEYFEKFEESQNIPLRPCRKPVNPMEHIDSDGEYLIADFSQDYYGVYTVSGSLEAYIKKGDLKDAGKPTKAKDFSEVKQEINFYNNQDIASFKIMSSLFFRDALEDKCEIDIAQLNLRTQYQFLNFINEYSEEKFSELKRFMDNGISPESKSNRLKSFLCLELDKNLGNQIILLGEKLSAENADLFFSKVAAINDFACKEESELGGVLLKDNQSLDSPALKSELLKKARDLVIKFSAIADDKLDNGQSKNIFSELDKIKTEMILFSGLLKSAKEKEQRINLETVKDLDLEQRVIDNKRGIVLSKSEKTQLIEIAKENYQAIFLQKGGNYNPEAYQRIISHYEQELENLDGQSIYILKYKDNIICSSKFQKISPLAVHASGLNVSKEIQGLSLGSIFNDKVLEEVSRQYDIQAVSRKDNPANAAYERAGFVITGEYKEADGVEYYKIVKPAKNKLSLEQAA